MSCLIFRLRLFHPRREVLLLPVSLPLQLLACQGEHFKSQCSTQVSSPTSLSFLHRDPSSCLWAQHSMPSTLRFLSIDLMTSAVCLRFNLVALLQAHTFTSVWWVLHSFLHSLLRLFVSFVSLDRSLLFGQSFLALFGWAMPVVSLCLIL